MHFSPNSANSKDFDAVKEIKSFSTNSPAKFSGSPVKPFSSLIHQNNTKMN